MPTQIVKINPGECIILPADAEITSITLTDGATFTSTCANTPTPGGTTTYYYKVEGAPAEDGSQLFFLKDLTIGSYISLFNDFRPGVDGIVGESGFIDVVKSNPAVIELRGREQSCAASTTCCYWSLTVPTGSPVPYFNCWEENDSSNRWYLRLYPMETDDQNYATTVSDLSDSGTIL